MDVTNHLRLRQGKEVTIIQQALGRVFKAIPPNIRFRHAIGTDRRAHRSVDDGNSTVQYLFQRMLAEFRHVSVIPLGNAVLLLST